MSTEIKFKSKIHADEFQKADDIIDWLNSNGYMAEANRVVGSRVFHAILGDMLNFIYESLNTIEKGKITVSLALLRKPFRDNLLYLEWLLSRSNEFISLVVDGDIERYAIENITGNKKRSIIKNAIKAIENKDYFDAMNDTVYYDLRYNYAAGNSLQLVWNKANHLVTTARSIRSKEFNFVFMEEDNHIEFVDYYYKQVPHLLFYTYNVVIKLYEKFIRIIPSTTKLYNNSLIIYKLSTHLGKINDKEYFNQDMEPLLNFPCLTCNSIITIDVEGKEFQDFKHGMSFLCTKCKNDIPICRYVFLEDYKERSPQNK